MDTKFTNRVNDIHLHYKIWISDKDDKGVHNLYHLSS